MKRKTRGKYMNYNTKKLKKLIASKGFTARDFSHQVSELCGKRESTVYSHVMGKGSPDEDEITAFAMVLDINEKNVSELCRISRETEKTVSKPREADMCTLNTEKLTALLEGKTRAVVERDIGTASGNIYRWIKTKRIRKEYLEKLAGYFGVPSSELIFRESEENTEDDSETRGKLESVDGVLNVFNVFGIMNRNLGMILNAVENKEASDQVDYALKTVEAKIDMLAERMQSLEEIVDGVKNLMASTAVHSAAVFRKTSKESPPANKTECCDKAVARNDIAVMKYDPQDSLEDYADKIDRFVKVIAANRNLTTNQIRHDYYNIMWNRYGVCWEQLQKEYAERHGKKQRWPVALFHENGLFGEIFFNILKTDAVNVFENKA